jgi:hypothetical protein
LQSKSIYDSEDRFAGNYYMGIRGVDIQVAIQRATDADKIQQGHTATARAGEAVLREEEERIRTENREQAQKSERGDEVGITPRRDKREHSSNERGNDESESETEEKPTHAGGVSRRPEDNHLDILA